MKRCMPLSNGVLFPGQVVSKEFRDRYVGKYHTDLRLDFAAHSYETAKIIAELFGNDQSSKYTPQIILDRLRNVHKTTSSVGAYQYSETAEEGKTIKFNEIIFTFKDGEIIPFAN